MAGATASRTTAAGGASGSSGTKAKGSEKGAERPREKSRNKAGAVEGRRSQRRAGDATVDDTDDEALIKVIGDDPAPNTQPNTQPNTTTQSGPGASATGNGAGAAAGKGTGVGVGLEMPSNKASRYHGLQNRLGHVTVPVSSLDELQRVVTFYTETCAVRHTPVTWANHAALLGKGQYSGILNNISENKHEVLSVNTRKRTDVADVLLGAAKYSLLKDNAPPTTSATSTLLGSMRGLDMNPDVRGVGSFRVVDKEDIVSSARRMVWLGNHIRTRGVTVCFDYSGRNNHAVNGMHAHIRDQWGGEPPDQEVEVVHDVDALYTPEAAQSAEMLLQDLLREPAPKLNYLELGVDGDAGETTRQSMLPMRGHCSFLGIGFSVGSLARTMEYLAHVAPSAAQVVDIYSILNMPRYILLEDEVGMPMELSDGIIANLLVESRRSTELAHNVVTYNK